MLPILPLALSLASQFAPAMLQYLTGSETAGAVAGKVVDIASLVTGGAADPVAALKADPALAIQFQQKVIEDETENVRLHMADKQDARKMQMAALGQDDLFSKRFVYYFAAAWSLFTMAYIAAITFWPPADAGQAIANTVLGFLLGTAVATIFSYFYGSNKGSADKTRLLAAK